MRRTILLVAVTAAAALTAGAYGAPKHKRGTLDTVAGRLAKMGHSGDGGPARRAKLQNPFSAVRDSHGNTYIAELDGHTVRKVDSHGKITTIAGTGKRGYSGDGGPAKHAKLNFPYAVALDSHDKPLHRRLGQLPGPASRREHRDDHHGRRHRQARRPPARRR